MVVFYFMVCSRTTGLWLKCAKVSLHDYMYIIGSVSDIIVLFSIGNYNNLV